MLQHVLFTLHPAQDQQGAGFIICTEVLNGRQWCKITTFDYIRIFAKFWFCSLATTLSNIDNGGRRVWGERGHSVEDWEDITRQESSARTVNKETCESEAAPNTHISLKIITESSDNLSNWSSDQRNHNLQDCLLMSRNVVIITGPRTWSDLLPLNNSGHNVQHYKKLIIW